MSVAPPPGAEDEPATPPLARAESTLDPISLGNVTIVHDYLNQRGGAEKVVLEFAAMWPDAPIYTSFYRPQSTFAEFQGRDIRTTALDRLPVDKGFRNLFPLYPAAFRTLGKLPGDVVIASSSGWAHMARAAPGALHVVYCHTPARWLHRSEYLSTGDHRAWRETAILPVKRVFRALDRHAARRADIYIANSGGVQQRIRAVYGIDAPVVYPPVDTERLVPRPRGERLLVIARLLPYKRVDLVVRAAKRLGLGLDVVGDGPMLAELRRIAGTGVKFHGVVSEAAIVQMLESCRAVCIAGEEEFGIVAVEAQAAGKPVIAYGRGGSLETVEEHVTGVLFQEQTEEALATAILAGERLDASPEELATRAQRFGRAAFRQNLLAAIEAQRLVSPPTNALRGRSRVRAGR